MKKWALRSCRTHFCRLHFLGGLLLCLFGIMMARSGNAQQTDDNPSPVPPELDAYLAIPDSTYSWEIIETSQSGPKTWMINMTSQTWHDIPWNHFLYIIEPTNLLFPDKALLFITGGSIGRTPGAGDITTANLLAQQTGSYVAMLFQVPNQPLFDGLYEDGLIAETLVRAIDEQDATWPALFPMAKSAIRAMDTVQSVVSQQRDRNIESFVVSGASKRGWTTWLTAASGDPRVKAIAPIVINTLNIQTQMEYQLETWGAWSDSIADYSSRNLLSQDPNAMDPFTKKLWWMIDPYAYLSRMNLPKLLIHGTNDPYWTVDATRFYWDDLSGPKFLLNLPNVGHDLGNEVFKGLGALSVFVQNIFKDQAFPSVTWTQGETEDGNSYTVDVQVPADALANPAATLWTAHSDTKDFRESEWTGKPLQAQSPGNYHAVIDKDSAGYVAYYVELFIQLGSEPFPITTEIWRQQDDVSSVSKRVWKGFHEE